MREQRENRSDRQVEADRATNRMRMTVHLAARSADQVEADKATDRKRMAL
jgi:hypothetical protein